MWFVGMALTPSRAAQDGMARIDTVDLDDRHSRPGAPRVSKPKLTKLFLALVMRQSQYYFGGEEVNRPFQQHALSLRLLKLNDPSKRHLFAENVVPGGG